MRRLLAMAFVVVAALNALVTPSAAAATPTRVSLRVDPNSVYAGNEDYPRKPIDFIGAVTPARRGHPVKLQQKINGAWRTRDGQLLDRYGYYRFTVKRGTGVHKFRTVVPAKDGFARGVSTTRTVTYWKIHRLIQLQTNGGAYEVQPAQYHYREYPESLVAELYEGEFAENTYTSVGCRRVYGLRGVPDLSDSGSMHFEVVADGSSIATGAGPLDSDVRGRRDLMIRAYLEVGPPDGLKGAWFDLRLACRPDAPTPRLLRSERGTRRAQ